ncbi:hypothetical protein M4D70_17270 [Brevibacillus borstelensis]|uniref:hypothetical protein n=1 Tax=Brevibacillus borstelensis TaxID=45462 RepID=UPI00117320C6|nr:hypothetical protein [Brevibacillus borstelensis]MCM3560727.1 hypothetical protein [Brevibacillus borstelensis]MCM3623981.1 hypothetical protein [Brevibacillus borstelensis]GED54780.1 hypothetical protein BBO01nite_40210 [Brevibacillus borstelensis]
MEEIVSMKLRNALLRLSLDNHFEEEIHRYHAEQNKHVYMQLSDLETEITFLKKRIEVIEKDIASGKAKPYYLDMLNEMRQELLEKDTEYSTLSATLNSVTIPDYYIDSVKYDMKTLISLLDNEDSSPQMIYQVASKYLSRVVIQRETKVMHMILQFKTGDITLYEKTLVADFTVQK